MCNITNYDYLSQAGHEVFDTADVKSTCIDPDAVFACYKADLSSCVDSNGDIV